METFDSVIDQIIRGACIASGIFYAGFMFAVIVKLVSNL